MNYYTSKQGDTLDLIAWLFYKTQSGRMVERLIEANPGLSQHLTFLPAGTVVSLPELAPEPVSQGVDLWT